MDVNVMVSALFWSGPPAQVVALAEAQLMSLFACPEILEELEDVLAREKFKEYLAEHAWVVNEAVEKFALLATLVTPTVTVEVCRDLEDNKVLECAIEAGADYIVSGDKDVLALREFKGIRIVTPHQFLRLPTVRLLRARLWLHRWWQKLVRWRVKKE